jgi:ADP-heptose:LPS heptosyltransferase
MRQITLLLEALLLGLIEAVGDFLHTRRALGALRARHLTVLLVVITTAQCASETQSVGVVRHALTTRKSRRITRRLALRLIVGVEDRGR